MAQQPPSIYLTMNTGNGLPSNYVFAVTEDANGFLWAGTDKGLCRFDGFRWTVWDRDNGLPGNYVNQVLSDGHGGLWLGISEKGFFHFSTQNGALQAVRLPGALVLSTVQTDPNGNLYAETVQNDRYTGYLVRATTAGVAEIVFQSKGGPPAVFRGAAGKSKLYVLLQTAADSAAVKAALQSQWPVTFRSMEKAMVPLPPVYHLSDSVLVTATDYYRFRTAGKVLQQWPLFAAGNSYAYTLATHRGLYVYNIKTGYYHFNGSEQPVFHNHTSGLGTDYVNHIYEAKDGTLMVSTLGAGLKLVKNRYRNTFFLDQQQVRSILPQGHDWLLLAGETIYQTKAAGRLLQAAAPAGPTAFDLTQNGDTVLLSTLKGIGFFSQQGGALRPLRFLEFTAGLSSTVAVKNGYLGGTYGSGLLHFRYGQVLRQQLDYPFRIIEKLVSLRQGFAALSHEDGLILTDPTARVHRHLTQKEGLLSNSVYTVYERGDTIWIGTRGGVALCTRGRVVQTLPFPPAFAGEKAVAVFFDRANRLWAVSNRCLYLQRGGRLLPLASYPLVEKDDAVTAAVYHPQRNEVAIGSGKTFSVIALDAVVPTTHLARPRLLKALLDGTKNLEASAFIPYHFSRLQFMLAPTATTPFSENELYYQLEGLSADWTPLQDSLAVSFAGLRPGAYTLWVKAVNADGYEGQPARLARFIVQKPFWQSWPFLALLLLLTVLLTWFILRVVERAKRRKKEAALLLQQSLHRERERIARDLHDHLGTNLATIIAQTDNIESRLYRGDWQKASQTVQHLSAQTRDTMNVLRETIWAVQETTHTLPEFVLRIRTFLQRHYEGTSIGWEVQENVPATLSLSPAQTLHLFRIVQEASQNILKHAGAELASYSFAWQEDQLCVRIADNGSGFSHHQQATNGLDNIRERVQQLQGRFTITTQPSVSMEVIVPLPAP